MDSNCGFPYNTCPRRLSDNTILKNPGVENKELTMPELDEKPILGQSPRARNLKGSHYFGRFMIKKIIDGRRAWWSNRVSIAADDFWRERLKSKKFLYFKSWNCIIRSYLINTLHSSEHIKVPSEARVQLSPQGVYAITSK